MNFFLWSFESYHIKLATDGMIIKQYILLGPPSNIFSSRLVGHIISLILPLNEYNCVNAWTTLGSDKQKKPILVIKKIIFSDELHFDLGEYVNKHNCTENPINTLKSRRSCPQSIMCLKSDRSFRLQHGQPRLPFEWNYFPL